ncbi:antigen peptide transporter 1 [Strigops habroptila]|uniref:Transporter 1, ATP binding cassette subfamily B member n=1 Tax=Strigops habroptila TaxID=2489341 RepID=A0A672U3A8_STRHB|nr:antigen peptide transporter 1 [Strigops habroptila]
MAPDPSRRFLSLFRPEQRRCTIVAGLMVASVLAEVTIPYFTGHVTDWVASEDEMVAISSLALLGLTSAITEFICDATYTGTLSRVFGHLHGRVFAAVLRRDLLSLRALGAGAVTSRVTTDVDVTHEAVANALLLLLWELARATLLLVPMAWVAPALATTTLLAMPVLLLLARAMGSVQQGLSQRVQEALAGATRVAMETFQAMATVRGFSFEAGAAKRYLQQLQQVHRLEATQAITYAATGWTSGFLALALKLGLLYYGGQMVAAGTITTGDLVTFLIYQTQFSSTVEVLLRYYPRMTKAVGSSEKIFEFLDEDEQRAPEGTLEPKVQGHLKLEDVWFSYPEQQEPVLKGVSLELLPGQVLAVVGAPGTGKSTLVSLVLRLIEPHRGRVLLDGHPLPAYRHLHLRQQVAVVPQEPLLFSRSLHANISYGSGGRSRAQVTAAARRAGADPFISRLPRGYDTEVGDLGTQLSGGQRQAVAIARALVRDPRVLVLDEPTSALDAKTSMQVEQEVLSAGRSVLLVTGRVALALRAQRVAVLAGGRLRELGNPTELLRPENRCWEPPEDGDTADQDGDTERWDGDTGSRDGDTENMDGDMKR